MKGSCHWLFVGVMLGSLIAASLCGFSDAQDQIAKLRDAFGPEFRPRLLEVQKLQDEALGLCYRGDLTQARSLLEKALRVTENSLGTDHRDISLLLTTLAELCISEGELDKAQDFLRRSLEIAQANGGSEHSIVADALQVQASLNMVLGKNDEALSACRRSLAIFEKTFGREHITVGLCLCELGDIYANQYRSREALAALERSRAIIETTLGAENFTLGAVFHDLSTVYREQGNYKAALRFAKESLKIREAFFGPSHPRVGESLAAVAWVCLYQEDYAEAERLFKRALAIFESGSDKDQRNVAVCLDKLVEIYWEQGDYSHALKIFDHSIGIKKRLYGENHPLVANSHETFGGIQQNLGNHEMALKAFGLCLKIRLDKLGKDHPSVANSVEHLGSVYLEMHDYTNALTCFEGTLSIREKAFGTDHPHVATSLADLAGFWYQFGQTLTNFNKRKHCIARSIGLQEQSIGILERVCGADAPEVVTAKEYLAAMLLAGGGLERAMVADNESLAGRRKHLIGQLAATPQSIAYGAIQRSFGSAEMFHSICAVGVENNLGAGNTLGAEQLAMNKALLEEIQIARTALNADPRTATGDLQDRYQAALTELARLPGVELDLVKREARRRALKVEWNQIEDKLAERIGLVAQTIRERNLTLTDIAQSLPPKSALVDFIQYRRYNFTARTNQWKEQRYAAYLTFSLGRDSTNVIVERVDLGEAAPINEAVELICKRMVTRRECLSPTFGTFRF